MSGRQWVFDEVLNTSDHHTAGVEDVAGAMIWLLSSSDGSVGGSPAGAHDAVQYTCAHLVVRLYFTHPYIGT